MTSTLEQKAIALWGAEGLAISIAKRLAAERARLIIISQYSTSSGLAQDLVQSYDGCQAIGIQGSLHSNVAAVALANEIRQIANETFSCRNIQAIIFCPSFPSHSTSSVSEIEASSHSIECAEPFLKTLSKDGISPEGMIDIIVPSAHTEDLGCNKHLLDKLLALPEALQNEAQAVTLCDADRVQVHQFSTDDLAECASAEDLEDFVLRCISRLQDSSNPADS